jgi:hypothetical protein
MKTYQFYPLKSYFHVYCTVQCTFNVRPLDIGKIAILDRAGHYSLRPYVSFVRNLPSRLAPRKYIYSKTVLFLLAVPVCSAILGAECPIIWAKECRKLVFWKIPSHPP